MSLAVSSRLQRERFSIDPTNNAARVLQLLLAQDGSTTRLCETVAGGPVELVLLQQRVTQDVPEAVRRHLPGETFIERVTSLAAQGQVLMDNLSYIALQGLDPAMASELNAGRLPIGHLLSRLWVRRERNADDSTALFEPLWAQVGLPDAAASRAYRILTPQSPLMLIAETYRRGLWVSA